ncbi:unnamed protein product [Arabidopsis halleri]
MGVKPTKDVSTDTVPEKEIEKSEDLRGEIKESSRRVSQINENIIRSDQETHAEPDLSDKEEEFTEEVVRDEASELTS